MNGTIDIYFLHYFSHTYIRNDDFFEIPCLERVSHHGIEKCQKAVVGSLYLVLAICLSFIRKVVEMVCKQAGIEYDFIDRFAEFIVHRCKETLFFSHFFAPAVSLLQFFVTFVGLIVEIEESGFHSVLVLCSGYAYDVNGDGPYLSV